VRAEPTKTWDEVVLDSASQIANTCLRVDACNLYCVCSGCFCYREWLVTLLYRRRSRRLATLASIFSPGPSSRRWPSICARRKKGGWTCRQRHSLVRFQKRFERPSKTFRKSYRSLLEISLRHRRAFPDHVLAFCLGSLAMLIPWLGRDFFPV